MANEIPQFFRNREGRRLFSILHRPAARSQKAVVFCAPLFEEKLWSHRVAVNFGRYLSARGVAVLRFDYFGDGESEGRFEQASVSSRVQDIQDAVTFCRAETAAAELHLVGLSFGASLATVAGLQDERIASVIAWSPVIDTERYVGDLLRANLTAQMVVHRKVVQDREALVQQILAGETVNIEGYELGKDLYTQMLAVKLLEALRASEKPVLVQQISPAEKVESQYAALAALENPRVRFEVVRELRFWVQQKKVFPPCDELFARGAAWLLERNGSC